MATPWQAAQQICTAWEEKLGDESESPAASMLKTPPLSTDGKGSGTSGAYDGGVRAC